MEKVLYIINKILVFYSRQGYTKDKDKFFSPTRINDYVVYDQDVCKYYPVYIYI